MSSTLKIGGLVSGIDTDSIVKSLMAAQRAPVDKLKQQKQILQWQQEDYREINTSLRSFRDKVFTMKLQSTFLAKSAVSSNENAVTATANTSATPGIYSVTVTRLAEGVLKGSQAALADEKDTNGTIKTLAKQFGLSGSVSFTLEGSSGNQSFTFDTSTDTIYTVAAAINKAALGISASYDATLNRFFLNSTTTGSAAKIRVTNDTGNFLSDPDGTAGANTLKLLLKNDGTTYSGQDAQFDFSGATNITSATNTVTVNGITLNLKQGGGATSTITVTNNIDSAVSAIKDFITSYNEIIDKINGKLSETRYRDYSPLTDEQKDKMSEDEIKKWEKFARSGLLRNDSILQGIVTGMRTTMNSSVAGLTAYSTLSSIGITTGLYSEKGKLYIDENKLRAALQENPEEVMKLFTNSSDAEPEKGLAVRLYDQVNNGISSIAAKAGSDSTYSLVDNSIIGKRLIEIDKNVKNLEDRLNKIEERYWQQFTAMEEAINKMNAQSAWLAQMFSSSR